MSTRAPPAGLHGSDSELPEDSHRAPKRVRAGTVGEVAIPLDEGAPDRRRVGVFWLEEGNAGLLLGAGILVFFVVLLLLAVIFRPV